MTTVVAWTLSQPAGAAAHEAPELASSAAATHAIIDFFIRSSLKLRSLPNR
jgi:hypothetical protein